MQRNKRGRQPANVELEGKKGRRMAGLFWLHPME
jgi:hypothetical protein